MPQGKLYVRHVSGAGTINALVVPEADPDAWYFHQFPVREVMDAYLKEYDLELVEGELENDDT